MKKLLHCLMMALVTLGMVLALNACGETPSPKPDDKPTPGDETPATGTLDIVKDGESDFELVYPAGNAAMQKRANELSARLYTLTGMRFRSVSSEEATGENRILVGNTADDIAKKLVEDVADGSDDLRWGYATGAHVIAFYATDDVAWEKLYTWLATFVDENGDLSVAYPASKVDLWTRKDYNKYLDDLDAERREAERQELNKKNDDLKKRIDAIGIADFMDCDYKGALPTGVYDMSEDARKRGYTVGTGNALTPTAGQHPRLLFTKDDLSDIRAYLRKNPDAETELKQQVDKCIAHLGLLSTPVATGKESTITNYSETVCRQIQATAFYYQLTGIEYYGYVAVLAMKNNLKTFQMAKYAHDQCRYFGYTAYTAACIYDWCYDLLTEDDKTEIAVGIEYKLFRGNSVGEYFVKDASGNATTTLKTATGGLKMEIGFPPTDQGSVSGHGTEYQLLRDYLSVAIAIYDENPSWFTFCGGRIYKEFVPIRNNWYDEAGIYPEGSACYAPWRFECDLFNAWIMKSATGKIPYTDNMVRMGYSLLAFETVNKNMFSTGDGNFQQMNVFFGMAMKVLANFYNDKTLAAHANLYGDSLSWVERLIANAGMPETDSSYLRKNLDAICYNAGYYQQIIARSEWDSDDAVVVLLRGAQKYAGGHTHADSGTFQIWYKGMLSGDDGVYDIYGSNHHYYYEQSSIAHNGILVYNPSKKDTEGGYYCGGQRSVLHLFNAGNNPTWINNTKVDMGKVTGVKYGYFDENNKNAKYVYYANDLSAAYASDTVEYYARTMLVTYTGDETYPMIMFVFDRIDATDAKFQKTFLLQCGAEPKIDNVAKTVTVSNGKGKMVLKSLLGTGEIQAYGGREKDASGNFKTRFWVSNANKANNSAGGASSSGSADNLACWGHADLLVPTGNKSDILLNLIYVTDDGTTRNLVSRAITAGDFKGAVALNQTALFYTGKGYSDADISFTAIGTSPMNYYIGGVAAGQWKVTVGGKDAGTFTVTDSEHVLTFSATTGNVQVTRVK